MAADGGWPKAAEPDDLSRGRADPVRGLLAELEGRLSAPGLEPLRPDRVAALADALAVLARRLDDQAERQAALAAGQVASEARIQARLDHTLAELAAVRAVRAGAERDPAPIRWVLGAASLAAALSVIAAGAILLAHPEVVTRPLAGLRSLGLSKLGLRPSLKSERAAVRPLPAVPPATRALKAPGPAAAGESYATVAAALERGEPTALPRLTGLAQAGNSQAQLALAGLYEAGAAGLGRDLGAARQWTRAAAEGGDRVAMYNLGLFFSEGAGGGRDYGEAAAWFRRAADRGVVDAQFNLGLLYEAGRGVEKNLREAYRWFAVAANAGDAAAREKQVDIEARLKTGERSGLDREVSGFQPGQAASGELLTVIPPAETLAETQALLARKGYYVGPVDGVASPAFRSAAQAYLRDHPELATRR